MFSYFSKFDQKFVSLLIVSLFVLSPVWAMIGEKDDKKGSPVVRRGPSSSNIRGSNFKQLLSIESKIEAEKTSPKHVPPPKPLPSTPPPLGASGALRKHSLPTKPDETKFTEKKPQLDPRKRGRSLPRIPVSKSKPLKDTDTQSNNSSPRRLLRKREISTPDQPTIEIEPRSNESKVSRYADTKSNRSSPSRLWKKEENTTSNQPRAEEKIDTPSKDSDVLKSKVPFFEAFQNDASSEKPELPPEVYEKRKQTTNMREDFEKAFNYFKSLSSKKTQKVSNEPENSDTPASKRKENFQKRRSKSFVVPRSNNSRSNNLLDSAFNLQTDEPKDSPKSPRIQRLKNSFMRSPSFFKRNNGTPPTSPKAHGNDIIIEKEDEGKSGEKEQNATERSKPRKFTREDELSIPRDNAVMEHKKRLKADSKLLLRVVDGVDLLTRAADSLAIDGDIDPEKYKHVIKPDAQVVINDTIKNVFPLIDKKTRELDPIKTDESVRGALNREKNFATGLQWGSEQLENSGELRFFNIRLEDAKQEEADKTMSPPNQTKLQAAQNGSAHIRINHPKKGKRSLMKGRDHRAATVVGPKGDQEDNTQNNKARPGRSLTASPPPPGSPRQPKSEN